MFSFYDWIADRHFIESFGQKLFIFRSMLLIANRRYKFYSQYYKSTLKWEAIFVESISTSPFCCVRFSPQKQVLKDEHALSWSNKASMLFSTCTPIPGAKSSRVASREKFKLGIAKGIELLFDQTLRWIGAKSSLRNVVLLSIVSSITT